MTKLIFGAGYLGRRVADRWREQGETVYVVTRSLEHAHAFAAQGLQPIVADVTQPDTLANLPVAETVLFAVGFDRAAGKSIAEVYVDGLAAVLQVLPEACSKLIYVSSTGVYGDGGGQWVNEDSVCQPTRDAGRACLAAERLLAASPLGPRSIVLRMAGLYGPGRIPRSQEIVAGRPLAVPTEGYLNLIYVDDAAEVVLAAERRAPPGRTYVVSDGTPVVRREYYAKLARLLGAPDPTFEAPAAGAPAALRAAADKRADNRRMLAELAVQLRFPTYREGLAAAVYGPHPRSGAGEPGN